MYKISVIIPVFNCEKTLSRAIDSILSQKWRGDLEKDIEIIIVDDCSTDNSKKVMEKYAKKFSNIRLFSTEINSGFPAEPRNIGIKKSNSMYIMFLDSDDEYCEDMCQTLFDVVTSEKADVVTCDFYYKINQNCQKHQPELIVEYFTESDKFICMDSINSVIFNEILSWNKIINRSLLIDNDIYFPTVYPNVLLEDRLFFLEVNSKLKKLIYIKNYSGVIYHHSNYSLSHVPDVRLLVDVLKPTEELSIIANDIIGFKLFEKYKYNFVGPIIGNAIYRSSLIKNRKNLRLLLEKLYESENKLSFDNTFTNNNYMIKVINFFILRNKISVTIFIIRIIQFIRIFK